MLYTYQTLYHGFRATTHWKEISSNKKSKYLLTKIIKIGYTQHMLEWWITIVYVCIDNLHFFYIFGFYRDSRTTVMNKDILLLFPNGNIIYYLLGCLGPIMIVCGLQTTPNLLNEGKGYYRLKKKSYKNLIIFRYLNDLLHISLKRGSSGMPQMGGKSIHIKCFF